MHVTPNYISDTKSESFREHPYALETVVQFQSLSQHHFFRLIKKNLFLRFALIFSDNTLLKWWVLLRFLRFY